MKILWKTSSRCSADKPMCVAVASNLAALRDTKTGLTLAGDVKSLVRLAKDTRENLA